MLLENTDEFRKMDSQNMVAEIDSLPDQLEAAWSLGGRLDLPIWDGARQVLVAGMGGSAIGGDLLAAYVEPVAQVPILMHRDYNLPAWVNGPDTLVIASSHSGNTEETLSAFEAAVERGARTLAVCTGGVLAEAAERKGVPLWRFEHAGQPRAAVGYSFGLLLAAMARLGFVPDPSDELSDAVAAMRTQQERLRADVPAVNNPAKRMGGQLMGRWVGVFASGLLAPVARRWKTQISEIAKAWAQFEFLPEADHNTLAGLFHPEELFPRTMMLFLRAPSDHPRNRLRIELTRKSFMLQGLNTDIIDVPGDTRLANQWTSLHYGDYVSYYLAMAYGVDPTPVEAIESFKQELSEANWP